eukprot:jgi/Galph1/797/GphlegSOOS_G5556.1
MANSKYSYVKDFEKDDRILPQVWIVVRVDGRSFTKFSEDHEFQKPNDERCLRLMEQSAAKVLENFDDCILAYGQSDEFSFILRRDTNIFNRRESSKILSCIVSLFSSSFVYYWKQFFEEIDLKYPPSFDARVVVYPSEKSLRDYLSWRQVDCHINNQYNVCFWSLVQNGMSPNEAYTLLKGTFADFKNELLFQRFGIIYSSISSRFRKGSIVFKNPVLTTQKSKFPCKVMISHEDLIGDEFWMQHPYLLCTSAKGWNSIIRQVFENQENYTENAKRLVRDNDAES